MEKYKEIEKSIIKKYRKEIWSKFIEAVKTYELIQDNDKIMVCISGGKDSFLLAKCIQELKRHGKINFEARYVVMDPGYNEYNRKYIEDNARILIFQLKYLKVIFLMLYRQLILKVLVIYVQKCVEVIYIIKQRKLDVIK